MDEVENYPSWSEWYQPGSKDDDEIYVDALKKCKEINEQLNTMPWLNSQPGTMTTKVIESEPRRYSEKWVKSLIGKESEKIKDKRASKNKGLQNLDDWADALIKIAQQLKPIIDIFVPQSPEYSVPYACIWAIFKGISNSKEKNDSVPSLINSLSQDISILEVYKEMFPTNDMKQALTEFYILTLDLLWRLTTYHSHSYFTKLTDAMLPRAKHDFPKFLDNIKKVAARLKTLCEAGHIAEQKHMAEGIENLDYGLSLLRFATSNLYAEVHSLKQQLQRTNLAQSRHYTSEIFDVWDCDAGNVEDEFHQWQTLRFFTDIRDHWSQNGILPCLTEWRKLCDNSQNSIFWISTQDNGRQSWLTEFSINLINICRSQGQLITFALCDRPKGVRWTPQQVLKQLVLQLLNSRPSLTASMPEVFNTRRFRKAETFDDVLQLLRAAVALLGPVVIVIDRLDKCTLDLAARHANIVQVLSLLIKLYPHLRIIVTTGQIVSPLMLPGLPISFAVVNTKRRPRLLEYKRSRGKRNPGLWLTPEHFWAPLDFAA